MKLVGDNTNKGAEKIALNNLLFMFILKCNQ